MNWSPSDKRQGCLPFPHPLFPFKNREGTAPLGRTSIQDHCPWLRLKPGLPPNYAQALVGLEMASSILCDLSCALGLHSGRTEGQSLYPNWRHHALPEPFPPCRWDSPYLAACYVSLPQGQSGGRVPGLTLVFQVQEGPLTADLPSL